MELLAYVPSKGDGRRVALRSQLPLVAEDAPTTWIQVAIEGTWKGHHSGEFSFTQEVFAQIVANFEKQRNAIPLTYEHPGHWGDGQPIPAAGWIHELEIREDGLWAFVEFTKRAAQMVRDGEYRFCSVVVGFESTDRESGEEAGVTLYEVGLVNSPFIDGMSEIRLSRVEAQKPDVIAEAWAALPEDEREQADKQFAAARFSDVRKARALYLARKASK